jgi:hypothetical protein
MLPGNVMNGTTYDFPVLCEVLDDVEFGDIARGDPAVLDVIVAAGRRLVRLGARAIVGACGSFANYQRGAAARLGVPTFMSIMLHVPLIHRSLMPDQRVGVICSKEEVITPRVLEEVGIDDPGVMVLQEAAHLSEFRRMMDGGGALNSAVLERQIVELSRDLVGRHPEIGALLLQCSDLPPYAAAVQAATGLPVFDMTTMVEWVQRSVVRRPYDGWV